MAKHVFRCVICGARLEVGSRPAKCPECGAKAFIHEEGESLRKKCGCTGSCSCCSGCGR